MAHDNYQHLMSLALDGLLPPHDESILQSHMDACPTCAAVWDAMRGLDGMLRAAPVAAPPSGFSARVMARVEAHRARRRWPEAAFWFALMALLGVVMLSRWLPGLAPLAAGVGLGGLPEPLAGGAALPLAALGVWGAALGALLEAVAHWLAYVASQPLAWGLGLTTLALVATWVGLIGVFGPGQPVPAREPARIS